MAVINLDYLKTFFQTYDKPTEEEFADLIDTLSTVIDIVTYHVPGNGNIWEDVNSSLQIDHQQKQLGVVYHAGVTYLFDAPLGTYGLGGIPTASNNYVKLVESQFTATQVEQLLALIVDDISVNTSLSVSQFEKGVVTSVVYTAIIDHEDVTVTQISVNGNTYPIGAIQTNIIIEDKLEETKSYVLTVNYIYNGVSKVYSETLTVYGYAPQFSGQSAITNYDLAPVNSILLSKYIGEGNNLVAKTVYNDMYLWFILSNNADIVDQNQNLFTVGEWTSNEFIIMKTGFVKLQNGQNEPVAFYRSLKTLNSKGITFKFESK